MTCAYIAVQELFAEPDNREFFISVGRDLISRLLLNAQKVSFIFTDIYYSEILTVLLGLS